MPGGPGTARVWDPRVAEHEEARAPCAAATVEGAAPDGAGSAALGRGRPGSLGPCVRGGHTRGRVRIRKEGPQAAPGDSPAVPLVKTWKLAGHTRVYQGVPWAGRARGDSFASTWSGPGGLRGPRFVPAQCLSPACPRPVAPTWPVCVHPEHPADFRGSDETGVF